MFIVPDMIESTYQQKLFEVQEESKMMEQEINGEVDDNEKI